MNRTQKYDAVQQNIAYRGSMLVAFSGGVDSSLLAVLARDVLGDKTRCVLLDSPLVPRAAITEAGQIARDHRLHLEIMPVPLMSDERFIKNPPDRCYYCKRIAAKSLKQRAAELGFTSVADGMNITDTGEHRPGLVASTEEGIVHPFIETGITKDDIRSIAQGSGYHFWNKPSAACLASRIPYGEEITAEKLMMIERAEAFIAGRGFAQVRVRLHGNVARIEIGKKDIRKLMTITEEVVQELKSIGFSYITVDLEGYRSGSMDEVL